MTRLFSYSCGLGIYAALAGNRLKITVRQSLCLLGGRVRKGKLSARKPHHGNDWASYIELKLREPPHKSTGGPSRSLPTAQKPNEFKTLQGKLIQIPIRNVESPLPTILYHFRPCLRFADALRSAVGYGANDVPSPHLRCAEYVLFYTLLIALRKAGHSLRTSSDNHWLVVCLAFGSAHLWCSVLGRVWFTALLLV